MNKTPLDDFKKLHNTYLYIDYKTSDLARCLNVSKRTVERWLSGRYMPSDEQLKKISKYLSIRQS